MNYSGLLCKNSLSNLYLISYALYILRPTGGLSPNFVLTKIVY